MKSARDVSYYAPTVELSLESTTPFDISDRYRRTKIKTLVSGQVEPRKVESEKV